MKASAVAVFAILAINDSYVSAQSESKPFSATAAFDFFSGQAEIGTLFPMELPTVSASTVETIIERMFDSQHLTAEQRWKPPLPGWGGVWRGDDGSGQVAVYVSSPEPFSKTTDMARVTFWPHSNDPLPTPILTHLMSKAQNTKITGADTLAVEFPLERTVPNGRCHSERTLTVRISTGAMVANEITARCERSQDAAHR